jgi:hypothetical protein
MAANRKEHFAEQASELCAKFFSGNIHPISDWFPAGGESVVLTDKQGQWLRDVAAQGRIYPDREGMCLPGWRVYYTYYRRQGGKGRGHLFAIHPLV